MPPRMVFGVETEMAVSSVGAEGRRRPPGHAAQAVGDEIRRQCRYLEGFADGGTWLENGSRFYTDTGAHPELATPEVEDPWDVVRYQRAGDAIAGDAIKALNLDGSGRHFTLTKVNVDYSGSGSTWGSHESYLHRQDPDGLPAQLVPFLVSRPVLAGAGGLDAHAASPRFMLSPRVRHLQHVVSDQSTESRGIFHTRNEKLAGPATNRLHLLCGESLQSHTSEVLRFGTTALVLCLLDGGLRPGPAVRLLDPLAAMHTYVTDPCCRAAARCGDGALRRAIDIQRHYLDCARAHVEAPFMPCWAPAICDLWGAMLDRLEHGWTAVQRTLDWAIKYAVYRDFIERRGQPIAMLLEHDRDAPAPPALVALRRKLCEIDVRYGQLGPTSIFDDLDDQGVLDHRQVDACEVDRARTTPPRRGRARVRGESVRSLQACRDRYFASWTSILDREEHRMLDLSDPLADDARWKPIDADPRPGIRGAWFRALQQERMERRRRGPRAGSGA